MWKFKNFFATQISREIKLDNVWVSKIAILTILQALNFKLLEIFTVFKCGILLENEVQSLQNGQNCSFRAPKIANFDFT